VGLTSDIIFPLWLLFDNSYDAIDYDKLKEINLFYVRFGVYNCDEAI